MKLYIEHETIFSYDGNVREAVGEARLRPREDGGQHLLSFRLALDPPTPFDRITDRFGNAIYCYSVLPPHRRSPRSRTLGPRSSVWRARCSCLRRTRARSSASRSEASA